MIDWIISYREFFRRFINKSIQPKIFNTKNTAINTTINITTYNTNWFLLNLIIIFFIFFSPFINYPLILPNFDTFSYILSLCPFSSYDMLSLMSLISYITFTDYFSLKFTSSSSDLVDYYKREYFERFFVEDLR